jgi:glycosyltransferase involved in cell wall biosynthesis
MSSSVKISIIIPNLHSPIIDQTLDSILAQETDLPYEIIVVGQDKYKLIERYDQVQFIQTPEPVGAAEARNLGIKAAHGEWFFFIDADCLAQPGWINAFAEEFNQGWQVVGGGVLTPQAPFWRLVYNLSMFHGQLASQKLSEPSFLPTLNLAVHQNVIEKVGLMDEALIRGQDVDWTSRMKLAGFNLLFKPSAAIEHLPKRQDWQSLRNYNFKSGYYMINVRFRYPEIFHMPGILKRPATWKLFGPLIAAVTTLKILIKTREVRDHLKITPYIYLQKLSWCYGAAKRLREIAKENE